MVKRPSSHEGQTGGAAQARPALDRERIFDLRLDRSRHDLFGMLERLYGHRPDYDQFRLRLLEVLRENWRRRPDDLKWLDLQRDLEPDWFQRSDQVGYVFYLDRFNNDLLGVLDRLDWLEALGVTYLHFMPCLKPRDGDNDGGYSVQDYRSINPAYGSMDDFEHVARVLRERGISLCIDLVLNHTSKEHEWAVKARAGEEPWTDYYLMFDNPDEPAAYEKTLIEIFPDQAPGSFTHYPEIDRWVWTTFNEHQWDLNWTNPWVFLEIVDIALFLANRGATVLRLDAVAFMWKRLGTRCQSEPEVHMLLHAFRAATRIAAPAVIHLEEAIVGPGEMIPYLGRGEHQGKEGNLAYHNSLMVQFWSALATADTDLMNHVMGTHFPPVVDNATYVTYLRCHDDIGWAITDEDAAAVGLSGYLHRRFLADFYAGSYAGSPARGALFQVNPKTGDARINGSSASLAGLEDALDRDDAEAVDRAIDRLLVGHALIASYGGIPLIYMGDEIGMLNDYSQLEQSGQADDGRWIHRPRMDWDRAEKAAAGVGVGGRILAGITQILQRRQAVDAFHGAYPTRVIALGNSRLFAFLREAPTGPVLCAFNLGADYEAVSAQLLRANGVVRFVDLLSQSDVTLHDDVLYLPPYGRIWLV